MSRTLVELQATFALDSVRELEEAVKAQLDEEGADPVMRAQMTRDFGKVKKFLEFLSDPEAGARS